MLIIKSVDFCNLPSKSSFILLELEEDTEYPAFSLAGVPVCLATDGSAVHPSSRCFLIHHQGLLAAGRRQLGAAALTGAVASVWCGKDQGCLNPAPQHSPTWHQLDFVGCQLHPQNTLRACRPGLSTTDCLQQGQQQGQWHPRLRPWTLHKLRPPSLPQGAQDVAGGSGAECRGAAPAGTQGCTTPCPRLLPAADTWTGI